MYTLRILSKGKISDLSNGFKVNDGKPFSIYVRPKEASSDIDLLVRCKCIADREMSEVPIPLNDWTPLALLRLDANAIDLSKYDVWYGCGDIVDE